MSRDGELLLLLIRHGEQATMRVNDAPLSERGERQAARLATRLAGVPLTAVVASKLQRAQQTAAAVAAAHGLGVETEPGLEEVDVAAETRKQHFDTGRAPLVEPTPEEYARTTLQAMRILPTLRWDQLPGVESSASLRERTSAAVDRIAARHPRGVVACVNHGGVINAILAAWCGIERDMWFVPWHTSINAVLVSGDLRTLLCLNDATHLHEDEQMLPLVAAAMLPEQTGQDAVQ